MNSLNKIEHIGIAVKSLKKGNKIYSQILNQAPYKTEKVESQKVITSFFKVGENKIELLEGMGKGNPIDKFISKRGEGVHHIAFEVDNIRAEMDRLKKQDFKLLNDKPLPGADNKLVCFIHPKNCNGVLIELCQEIRE
jgi:methylmalonyl-CoA/ethylmalonyl-CoA epimerase